MSNACSETDWDKNILVLSVFMLQDVHRSLKKVEKKIHPLAAYSYSFHCKFVEYERIDCLHPCFFVVESC